MDCSALYDNEGNIIFNEADCGRTGIVEFKLIVVDKDGNMINKHIGYNPGDEVRLEKEIVELLLPQIKADTSLTDTTILNVLKAIDSEK